jgi:hypothetical protein
VFKSQNSNHCVIFKNKVDQGFLQFCSPHFFSLLSKFPPNYRGTSADPSRHIKCVGTHRLTEDRLAGDEQDLMLE